MAISSEVRKAGPFTGTGTVTAFPFNFKVFAASDLVVYLTEPNGSETTMQIGRDYTVQINADQEASPGGTVNTVLPLASGRLLTISSMLPYLQPARLTNQGGFYPDVINAALDRLTILAQQNAEQIGRSVKVPISSSTTPDGLISQLTADAAKASTAAASAASSQAAASDSAAVASTKAGEASNSATAAVASQAAAASSASSASGSAQTATTQAAQATTQAQAASTSATQANTSRQQAQTAATTATTQAQAASTSAQNASASAQNAASSAQAAAASAASVPPLSADLKDSSNVAKGDALIGYKNPSTGSVARSLHAKMTDFWVTPQDFGAAADGVNDDRAAIVAAIASGRPVYIPAGTYKVSARITVPPNTYIRGDWQRTEIIFGTNADWLFEITGSSVVIEGLRLNFSALSSGSGAILLRTDLTTMEQIYLRDIRTAGASYLLSDLAHATNVVVMLHVQNVVSRMHRGPGIELRRAFAYLILKFVTIDYVGSASRAHTAYSLSGNQGSYWENVDVTSGLVDATTANAHGFSFANCIAVWMSNCMADTCGGHGFYFTTGNTYFYLNNCIASLCGKIGFAIVAGGNMRLTQCVASGRKGMSYAPVWEGFRIESGADRVQLTGTHAINNAGNGITLASATRVTISGHRTDNSGGRGLDSAGTNSALITGSCFDLNPSGNVNLSSAGMIVSSCQASSGTLLAVTGPGSA